MGVLITQIVLLAHFVHGVALACRPKTSLAPTMLSVPKVQIVILLNESVSSPKSTVPPSPGCLKSLPVSASSHRLHPNPYT